MSGSGRVALSDVREWSKGYPECPVVVGRPSWMSGSCREALPYFWEWLRNPPSCPGVVGDPPGCLGLSGVPLRSSGGHPGGL